MSAFDPFRWGVTKSGQCQLFYRFSYIGASLYDDDDRLLVVCDQIASWTFWCNLASCRSTSKNLTLQISCNLAATRWELQPQACCPVFKLQKLRFSRNFLKLPELAFSNCFQVKSESEHEITDISFLFLFVSISAKEIVLLKLWYFVRQNYFLAGETQVLSITHYFKHRT